MQRGLLTGIILGVAMVIFAIQNSVSVSVKLLWMKFSEVPLALILMIAILIGVSITAIFSFIDNQRLKNRIKRLQSKLKVYENQTAEEEAMYESGESNSENGMTIKGEPGNKFFDY